MKRCRCGVELREVLDFDACPYTPDQCGACARADMRAQLERDQAERAFLRSVARPDCLACEGAGVLYTVRPCAACLIAEVRRLRAAAEKPCP